MKKILFAGCLLFAMWSTNACERAKNNNETENADSDKRVVKRDSVATEYEVTETVVEYDTTQRTKTVKADADTEKREDNDKIIEVKKDKD